MFDPKEAELKSLRREWEEIQSLYRNKPIELDEPIFQGWVRLYVLSERASQREDAHILGDILERINIKIYSKTKVFKETKKQRKSRRGRNPEYVLKPKLRKISEHIWKNGKLEEKGWGRYFKKDLLFEYKKWARYYVFRYPHLLELIQKKHYKYKLPPLNSEYNSRYVKFWRLVGKSKKIGKLYKSLNWRNSRSYSKREEPSKSQLINKEICQEISKNSEILLRFS